MAVFDPTQVVWTATDPRREVWPSVGFSYFDREVIEGTGFFIQQGDQSVWTNTEEWLLHSKYVLSVNVYLTADEGAALKLSFNPGDFVANCLCFRFCKGMNVLSGIELGAWAVNFRMESCGVGNIKGSLCLRGA